MPPRKRRIESVNAHAYAWLDSLGLNEDNCGRYVSHFFRTWKAIARGRTPPNFGKAQSQAQAYAASNPASTHGSGSAPGGGTGAALS